MRSRFGFDIEYGCNGRASGQHVRRSLARRTAGRARQERVHAEEH
jgi:hypothetical protein